MSKNVFLDLGFSEDEAAGLKLRSYLFMALQDIVKSSKLKQSEIGIILGADQPKVSKIINGNFSEFSIERITEYLQKLGYDIHVKTTRCPPGRKIGTVITDNKKRQLAAAR
jgi:predicted XRE-type DNA-binding protein